MLLLLVPLVGVNTPSSASPAAAGGACALLLTQVENKGRKVLLEMGRRWPWTWTDGDELLEMCSGKEECSAQVGVCEGAAAVGHLHWGRDTPEQ